MRTVQKPFVSITAAEAVPGPKSPFVSSPTSLLSPLTPGTPLSPFTTTRATTAPMTTPPTPTPTPTPTKPITNGESHDNSGIEVSQQGVYPLKYLYDIGGWFFMYLCMNYIGLSFMLLRASWSFRVWGSVFFYGHILPFVGLFVCKIVRMLRPKRSKSTKTH